MSSRKCLKCKKKDGAANLEEGICQACRSSLKRILCTLCSKPTFHISKSQPKHCKACRDDAEIYGDPEECDTCGLQSAFGGHTCRHCQKMRRKYGNPTTCAGCNRECAFDRTSSNESSEGATVYCYACTIKQKRENKRASSSSEGKSRKRPASSRTSAPGQKWVKLLHQYESYQKTFVESQKQMEEQVYSYHQKILDAQEAEMVAKLEAKEALFNLNQQRIELKRREGVLGTDIVVLPRSVRHLRKSLQKSVVDQNLVKKHLSVKISQLKSLKSLQKTSSNSG